MAGVHAAGRRWSAWLWVVAVIVAAGLGLVFGRWAFTAPQAGEPTSQPATVTVSQMTVGRSIPVPVTATWTAHPFGIGAASGVLTSLDAKDGGVVTLGDRLYTVDLRPVVAAVGAIPAFRDLAERATGADVTQLEQFLAGAGFLADPVDAYFGSATTAAVKAWQASLGVEKDGVVRAGDILYAVHLPARVRLADGVAVGDRVAAGDAVLAVLDGDPQFTATITATSPISPALPIDITFGGETVAAVVSSTREDLSGNRTLVLTRADGSPVCAGRCDEVSLEPSQAVYPARQVLTPEATGPGVPAAAVWFTAAGEPYLVTPDGTHLPVTIVSEGQGSVVLAGVDIGTTVVLAGTPGTTPIPPAPTSTPS